MRSAALLVLVVGALIAANEAIPTVNSWGDFRALLKSQGRTDAEIDGQVAAMLGSLKTMDRSVGNDLIGANAPGFEFDQWLNSKPMAITDLRGKVVLLRWWTDTCPLCASTSPALRKLHEQYSSKGLTVIGVFHPKLGREKPLDVERVRQAVASRQYTFPVAIDWEWRTLKNWWLDSRPKGVRVPTSVTFILDKKGVVRYVHPGMEYHDGPASEEHAACENDMSAIRAMVDRLITE